MTAIATDLPPTELSEVDEKLQRLVTHSGTWAQMPAAERAQLLRACMKTTLAEAHAWAETSARIKGYPLGSQGHAEEYLGGVLPTLRNLRLFAEGLEAGGGARPAKTWQRPDGQWVARVFPRSLLDRALFTGVTCDIWIEPGKEPTQGRIYREGVQDRGVAVVLGAGNQSSIPAMDVLYKLVVDNEVCILKMNPVNEGLGPILERALGPLVAAGFLEICYGGVEVGKHLTDHPDVTSIHITGSAKAHDAIIWGPGEEGARNKAAGTPRIDKHITSELGCVSPVLVVPGPWSEAQLDYHARSVASMLTYNCGFNCNAARLVVVAKGWALRERFLSKVKERLAATPPRQAYYPNAEPIWASFLEQYPQATKLGEPGEGELPWTVVESLSPDQDEYALKNEPWCGLFSFVELDATAPDEFLDQAVPFVNDEVWGTLTANVLVHPRTERELGPRLDQAIANLRYGGIGINCWTGMNYAISEATWGAFPGHPLDDIESGQGVVHNGLMFDHPQKSVVRAPFVMSPTPAWFTDHANSLALAEKITAFEANPSWWRFPGVAMAALRG